MPALCWKQSQPSTEPSEVGGDQKCDSQAKKVAHPCHDVSFLFIFWVVSKCNVVVSFGFQRAISWFRTGEGFGGANAWLQKTYWETSICLFTTTTPQINHRGFKGSF
ncbi:UNVERIFIED_CONTAM: hypothetical protein K2H54_044241 [Gekko kuhli]